MPKKTEAQLRRIREGGGTVKNTPPPIDMKAMVSGIAAAAQGSNADVIAALETLTAAVTAKSADVDMAPVAAAIEKLAAKLVVPKKQAYKFEIERDTMHLTKSVKAIPIEE